MPTLESIIKTEDSIKKLGYGISNNIITCVDINTVGHFDNSVCFEIMCSNVYPMAMYHNTSNIGYLIRSFIELFDLTEEDGMRLSKIKNIPCRLVFDDPNPNCTWGSKCIGFGHFMDDKFVLTDDFAKIDCI